MAVLCTAVLLFLALHPVAAAEFVVTSDADSGPGTLREAIINAEANGEADQITFATDMLIVVDTYFPDITTEILITGLGWDRTILDGGLDPGVSWGTTLFKIQQDGILTLDGVMTQNCRRDGGVWSGGAVTNFSGGVFRFLNSRAENNEADYGGWLYDAGGEVKIEGSMLSNNRADGGSGGGAICSGGNLSIRNSTFAGNSADSDSGGAIATWGSVFLDGCLFVGNTTAGCGGAIYSNSHGRIRIANSTFSANVAYWGGAICGWESDDAWLYNVTVTENTGTSYAGGIMLRSDQMLGIQHSIIAGNDGGNCDGPLTSGGYNLEDTDTCSLGALDLINTDPQLGPLVQWQDGWTSYHPLLPDSPTIDAGNPDGCTWDHDGDDATDPVLLSTDQRAVARPQDGDYDTDARCDIGAVEWGAIFFDGFESGTTAGWVDIPPHSPPPQQPADAPQHREDAVEDRADDHHHRTRIHQL